MRLPAFLEHNRLDNSLLIGFYGGGNYGDELLMEILAGLLKEQGTKNVAIAYQELDLYQQFHHEFGFELVAMRNKKALLRAILKARTIVVGGGGLWGMDANFNILLMSMMLLFSRVVLRKQIYLLAVGYYDSSSQLGRLSAWMAGKSANHILARDQETYRNFKKIQTETYKDIDIAWYIDQLNLAPYQDDLAKLEKRVQVQSKTLFVTLRRFRGAHKHHLAAIIAQCLQQNADKPIIIALLEPKYVDPEGYQLLQSWQRSNPNVQVLDFTFNPLALFLFFRKYHEQLVFIGQQFHGILSAHLTCVPYLPLAYDNKVQNLLKRIAPTQKPYALHNLRALDVQRFIDQQITA